jgi:hypothetical protein
MPKQKQSLETYCDKCKRQDRQRRDHPHKLRLDRVASARRSEAANRVDVAARMGFSLVTVTAFSAVEN